MYSCSWKRKMCLAPQCIQITTLIAKAARQNRIFFFKLSAEDHFSLKASIFGKSKNGPTHLQQRWMVESLALYIFFPLINFQKYLTGAPETNWNVNPFEAINPDKDFFWECLFCFSFYNHRTYNMWIGILCYFYSTVHDKYDKVLYNKTLSETIKTKTNHKQV